ncbi:MAG: hypothetical protein NC453_26750 [Muribaculum sp.]|nr:hypothetical protein [Muribaculum sp.]
MWGQIIGAGISAVGSIFGGIKASEAMQEAKKGVEKQKQKNQDWYDRRYNEDATQRADAQAILSRTEESIRNRNRAAAGTAAVMGGTVEGQQAAQAANNEALTNATTTIAANADRRKDAIENQYLQTDNQLQGQLNDIERQRAGQIAEATKGVTQAGANIASLF